MAEGKLGHLTKLPIDAIKEVVSVKPQVECPKSEILGVLRDIKTAVDGRDYVPQAPTRDSPSLSDVYIFDFVKEAQKREIYTPQDIKMVSHSEYEKKWYQFCDEYFKTH